MLAGGAQVLLWSLSPHMRMHPDGTAEWHLCQVQSPVKVTARRTLLAYGNGDSSSSDDAPGDDWMLVLCSRDQVHLLSWQKMLTPASYSFSSADPVAATAG